MFETIKNAFKVKEIRIKILWTLLFLLLYRIGSYIPVPGVGDKLLSTNQDFSYLKIMNMMTGGSLANGTLFAMGIGPYINSSIIMHSASRKIIQTGRRRKKKDFVLHEIFNDPSRNHSICRYHNQLRFGRGNGRRTQRDFSRRSR